MDGTALRQIMTEGETEESRVVTAAILFLNKYIFPWLLREKCSFSVNQVHAQEIRVKMATSSFERFEEEVNQLKSIINGKKRFEVLRKKPPRKLFIFVSGRFLTSGGETVLTLSFEIV